MSQLNHRKDRCSEYLSKHMPKSTVMSRPRLVKVVLNMGSGEAIKDKKLLDHAINDMEAIAGQKPVKTLTRRSEAGFKIREGWPIGCKVTLRRENMHNFIENLVSIVLPQVRDFKGLSQKSFDGRGNYNIGLKEQIVFKQIKYDQIDRLRGLNITITTTAKSDEEGMLLLKGLGFPFIKKKGDN